MGAGRGKPISSTPAPFITNSLFSMEMYRPYYNLKAILAYIIIISANYCKIHE
jgi:hypothetical protein